MSVTYNSTSPYAGTQLWGQFLDTWSGKYIQPDIADKVYQIDPPYNNRPDLLANDLYQDATLWWVFAVRNPDVLKDPTFDFVAPKIIILPPKSAILTSIGY